MPTLVGPALDAAVAYNERRGLDRATIEEIQQIVGAKVDGKLGPRTAQAVFEWQGTVDLVQDGKIGPKTMAAVAEAVVPRHLIHPVDPDIELARIEGDDDLHQTRELEDMRAGMTPKPRTPRPSDDPAASSGEPEADCPPS